MVTERTRLAVLGSPIAHSKSPAIQSAAYRELGLPWTYEAIRVDEAGMPAFLDGLGPEWRGLSLTASRLWRCRPGGGGGDDPVPDA